MEITWDDQTKGRNILRMAKVQILKITCGTQSSPHINIKDHTHNNIPKMESGIVNYSLTIHNENNCIYISTLK